MTSIPAKIKMEKIIYLGCSSVSISLFKGWPKNRLSKCRENGKGGYSTYVRRV